MNSRLVNLVALGRVSVEDEAVFTQEAAAGQFQLLLRELGAFARHSYLFWLLAGVSEVV